MKLITCIFYILSLMIVHSTKADILVPPEEARAAKLEYQKRLETYKQQAKTCPRDKPLYSSDLHQCFSCDDPREIPIDIGECETLCDNRYSYTLSGRKCGLMTKKQQQMKAANNNTNHPQNNSRRHIPDRGAWEASQQYAREYQYKQAIYCNKEHPIYHVGKNSQTGEKENRCYRCSWPEPLVFDGGYSVASQCTFLCASRELRPDPVIQDRYECFLKKGRIFGITPENEKEWQELEASASIYGHNDCPKDTPLLQVDFPTGNRFCHACNEKEDLRFVDNCSTLCPNRQELRDDKGPICRLKFTQKNGPTSPNSNFKEVNVNSFKR